MIVYESLKDQLNANPKTWLITGVAGFIGSNLLEALLKLNQHVIGLDNFSTGYQNNIDEVKTLVSPSQWARFRFVKGDICDLTTCKNVCDGVDYVLHQAALGSVPRSIEDPILTNKNNIDGFLNILVAARDSKIKRFVYAASSSTYGDHIDLPKVEDRIGKPLSPYAVTKFVNELYAGVFASTYGIKCVGLRYFNVFGRRQDPDGAYAAVIPKWIAAMIRQEPIFINGDGETSRDFCYVDNAVQANLLAATTYKEDAIDQVYNVAVGEQTSLKKLYDFLKDAIEKKFPQLNIAEPNYSDFRRGDIRHSLAEIEKIKKLLGYQPKYRVEEGLNETLDWYFSLVFKRQLNIQRSSRCV